MPKDNAPVAATGYLPQPTHYRLNFADGPVGGAVITVRSVAIRQRLAFDKVRFTLPTTTEEADRYIQDIYAEFVDRLVDWDLIYPDGTPVPRTVDGLLDQDEHAVQAIIKAWIDVIDAAPGRAESDPTEPGFDPATIPMVPLGPPVPDTNEP